MQIRHKLDSRHNTSDPLKANHKYLGSPVLSNRFEVDHWRGLLLPIMLAPPWFCCSFAQQQDVSVCLFHKSVGQNAEDVLLSG